MTSTRNNKDLKNGLLQKIKNREKTIKKKSTIMGCQNIKNLKI